MVIKRYSGAAMGYIVRQARTRDVSEIRALIDQNVGSRRLLDKHTVNLYEDILEFSVAEASADGRRRRMRRAARYVGGPRRDQDGRR